MGHQSLQTIQTDVIQLQAREFFLSLLGRRSLCFFIYAVFPEMSSSFLADFFQLVLGECLS